jgi:hypothetical protein
MMICFPLQRQRFSQTGAPIDPSWGLMPESAGSYASKNKYLISLYIFHYTFSDLAEKTVSRK